MDIYEVEVRKKHRRDCLWCLILGPLFVVASLCLSGCGSGPAVPYFEGRAGVSGDVTLDGQPLPEGMIEFVPQGKGRGPRAMAEIKEGKFVLDKDHGPVIGPMRVEITVTQDDGEPPAPGEPRKGFKKEALPARYNERSELKADVKNEKEGENSFVFALKSR
jgi:hypothetical protein